MANHTVPAGHVGVYNKTLTADTVDSVTFTGADIDEVEVMTDGTAEIYVAFGSETPTVEGTHCWRIPAVAGSTVLCPKTRGATVVKLISSGTPEYSVARAA